MAKTKIYALVHPNGKMDFMETEWGNVEPLVSGTMIKYKGFLDHVSAKKWASEEVLKFNSASGKISGSEKKPSYPFKVGPQKPGNKKIYALVYLDGKKTIMEAEWEKVKPIVSGTPIRFKGFLDRKSAEEWANEEVVKFKSDLEKIKALKKIKEDNAFSKTDWMASNINSPYWNKRRRGK